MTEQQIQTKVINALRKDGWYVNKLISTSLKGVPDLIAHKDGRTIYIEVKRPGMKPRKLQEFRMQELEAYGVKCFTIDSVEKLKQVI